MTDAQRALKQPPFDLPQYPMPLLGTRGVYHPMTLTEPHTAEHQRWFSETCDQVEGFVAAWSRINDEVRASLSLSIHLLADALFLRLGPEACWSKVSAPDLAAMAGALPRQLVATTFTMLSIFYDHLGDSEVVDKTLANRWASILHDIAGIDPTDLDPRRTARAAESPPRTRNARHRAKQARHKNRKR